MATSKKRPSIPEWFRGRSVLVTGGTGFMGKVLLAKLLTSCPDIASIYVIIRSKKGVTPDNRMQALLEQEPFRILREKYPERQKKLVVVQGDTTCSNLGINGTIADAIKNNVSVVINMAANVRFDLSLKLAVNVNTKSVINVIAFAKQMPKLDSFIHVSTAYCHCGEPVLEEKYYPVCMSPEEMIELVDGTSEEVLATLTPKLLGDNPNTYALTKALSEELVVRSGLPAGICRPSIVIGSLKEPDRGWVDNLNGPTGLIIGAGKGVIRSMLCNSDYFVDVIPCDIAVNGTVALTWQVGLEKPKSPIFVNLTESHENPLTWRYALETGKKHALANPFSGPLWYPGGGNKPFLIKVQARVTYGIGLVYYYTTKQWIFKNDNLKALREALNPEDKEVFFMDIKEISWDEYLRTYILAARKYCLKDDPSTLPKARRVFAYLYVIDLIVKFGFLLLIGWLLYSWVFQDKVTVGTTLDATLIP